MNKTKKILLIVSITLLVLIAGGFIGFDMYVDDYYHSDTNCEPALTTDETITVKDTDDFITFEPKEYDTGIIFYPGGKVEAESYAPLCRKWSEEGIYVVIVKMPYNLAILDEDKASEVTNNKVEHWYMAGHSLGGVCASDYISEHVDAFDGLILLASYSTKDLSDSELKVLSIYGSNDEVLNKDSYSKNRDNLPSNTMEEIIFGGNHCQFGSYGYQDGDGMASISREEQWKMTVEYTKMLLEE